jgi:hypothetical protein
LPRAGSTPFVLAILFGLSAPRVAEADLFVARDGESVVVAARRAVIAHHDGKESLIEELEITSTSPRFVWLRAFPTAPTVASGRPELFRTLEAGTVVEEPLNEQVRRLLFGPSVVTLITRRLAGARPEPEDDYREELRTTSIDPPLVFSGKVTTSTITYELVLPPELAAWFGAQGITPTEELERELARYLNRDWLLVGTAVSDAAPSSTGRARLGPIRYDFATESMLYPQIGLDRPWVRTPPTELYLIGDAPLAPTTLRTLWDARSWEKKSKPRSELVVTWAHPIEQDGPLLDELRESALPLPEEAFLVRGSYERGTEALVDLTFVPAKDAEVIPGSDRRRSFADIFLCMLLGLTPLIYTPESWFLLWVAARAKARARREGKAFGTRLWSFYALAVALFWFVTIDDVGRLAALIPMLIGIGQLAMPYTEREPSPIRVQFKKKKPS